MILDDLLLKKEMSGKVLLVWRYSLIKEISKKRYATPDSLKAAHAEIANLFFLEFTKNEEKQNEVDGEKETRESYKDI